MKLTTSSGTTVLLLLMLNMVCLVAAASAQVRSLPAVPARPPLRIAAVDPGPIGAATTTAVFAQVAIGGGYTTTFTFLNTGATAITGNLILTDSSGSPMNASLTEPSLRSESPSAGRVDAIGPSIPLNINPGGTQFITAGPAAASDPTKAGWARVESEGGTLGGVATFQYAPGGLLSTIAGVLASGAVEFATIPVDNDDGGKRYTGFAIANTGNAALTVRIVPVNANGSVVPGLSISRTLSAGAQLATFLHQEWTAPEALSFKGTVVLIAPTGRTFAVVALVLNQGLLTAIPVVPAKAPAIN